MVREISLLRDTQDTANFRIPRGMEERRCGLRLLPKRSLSKTSQFGAGEPDPGSGKVVGEGPQGVRTVSPLRHQVFKVFRSSREGEGTRSLLGSRLRRKQARFPSFWRWWGWDFGFSSDGQWGSNLCGVPLAALIGLALGGRGRRDTSSHQPICLQRWRA